MAKAKARKRGAARRTRKASTTKRAAGRKSARKPARRAAARKAGKGKTARTAARKAAKPARRGTAARRAGTSKPRIGKAKGGQRRAAPRSHPRGSSGPGAGPYPTRPSTRTGAGAGVSRSPYLERTRRQLREVEEGVPTPPSSLDLDRSASAVRSGRAELSEALHKHTETSPALTGGDVDADWQGAYSVGDEAAGGDNPTPDQQRVDDIGKALGVEYQDNEELRAVDKLDERDKHRWELDPASAEDYKERQK